MSDRIRIIQYGLGSIGRGAARLVSEREALQLVGGVDIDPEKVGQDLGDLLELGAPLGVAVRERLAAVLSRTGADVVIHTTSSYFDRFSPEIVEILEAGLDVVSTAEELSFPWLAHRSQATEIDAIARRAGKTVLGTGVNPGFLMDALPVSLSAICQSVDHIRIERVINASARRRPFQAKIGSGMRVEDFNSKMEAGRMGHVGLPESMGMLFHAFGKELAHYESSVEPVIAEVITRTSHFEVQPGEVKGLRQVARGFTKEGEFASLTFIAGLAMEGEGDTIQISGIPDLRIMLKGTNGDLATVAIAVNAVRRVREAEPGLKTMLDLPMLVGK